MSTDKTKLQRLKNTIQKEVLVSNGKQKILASSGIEGGWLFDFRNIILKPHYIDLIAEIFWDILEDEYPFQVGGSEVAAIPIVTAIVMKSKERGKAVNGFFIRKSRKKYGSLKVLEGELNEHKIVLVDDLINSGKTFIRQIEIIEKLGRKVDKIVTIMHFRNTEEYTFAKEKKIDIVSFFGLPDFGKKYLRKKQGDVIPKNDFEIEWYFKSKDPNYFYSVPKSAPALDTEKLYFGSDSGNFWALNQIDGSVAWKYRVGWHAKGKAIFSSPAVCNNTVYFGSYDGNVYALDSATGKKKWVFKEADWIGSSPALAPKLGLLFIGLEFGLFKKQGGIVALDLLTGKKRWEYVLPELTHSSPLYIPEKDIVAIGSNDKMVYLFHAKKGALLWQVKTKGDIKESFAYSKKRNVIFFGSHDGNLYGVNVSSGKVEYIFETKDTIYSTPFVHENMVFVTSLDKRLYCFDLKTRSCNWIFETRGRIFASPKIISGMLYVGSNDGILYEIDPYTGKEQSIFFAAERITNRIAYNEKTECFFVPTFANEIYCIRKKSSL